jgi:hypothetical protein
MGTSASHPLWLRCAWCGRYEDAGSWVVFGAADRPPADRTSHGICPECLEQQHLAAEERRRGVASP